MYTRKTKIVCTLGPSSNDYETVKRLAEAGMDVARLNFSHGNHEEHLQRINLVKRVRAETGRHIALLADTKGPEVRLREVVKGTVLQSGQVFTLATAELVGDAERASVTFAGLPGDVEHGVKILIDDGLVEMVVESVDGENIHCRVIHGGAISSKKGVNVPGTPLSMPYISEQDRADLRFARVVERIIDLPHRGSYIDIHTRR